MQCDNKFCMHPDWRCNGVNDCGDYTDERNCNAVPVPPIVELIGCTYYLCNSVNKSLVCV